MREAWPEFASLTLLFSNRTRWLCTCIRECMILIVTPSDKGDQCAKTIQELLGEASHIAPSTRKAIGYLRANEYTAVLVDQLFLEAEPAESETVLEHVGLAVPVYVNFAINGLERVVRELRWALNRRQHELRLARAGAKESLRNELADTVTALLLSCELALRTPNLEVAALHKIRTAHDLARQLREKLEIPATQ